MNLKNKQEIIEKFGANAKDTGSAEVQIAMLTKKISELTELLKEKNLEGYRSLIKELGIRG